MLIIIKLNVLMKYDYLHFLFENEDIKLPYNYRLLQHKIYYDVYSNYKDVIIILIRYFILIVF